MVKAVVFDVDGVLIDSLEANFKFCHDLFEKGGVDKILTREDYSKMFHLSLYNVITNFIGTSDMEKVNKLFKMGKNRDVRYPSELVKVTDGVEEVMRLLYEKYELAIATSRIRGGVFELPQLKPVEKYFKAVVCFEDTEKHKPDPDPLILAAKRLSVETKDAVYVGDALSDVKAAKSSGMRIIGFGIKELGEVDGQTSSFFELPKIIEGF